MRIMLLHLAFIFVIGSVSASSEPIVSGTQSYSSPYVGQAIQTLGVGANYFQIQSILNMMQSDQDREDGRGMGKKGHGKGHGKRKGKGCGKDKGRALADQTASLLFLMESLKKADCLSQGGTIGPMGGCSNLQLPPPGTVYPIQMPTPYRPAPRPVTFTAEDDRGLMALEAQLVNLNRPIQ